MSIVCGFFSFLFVSENLPSSCSRDLFCGPEQYRCGEVRILCCIDF